MNSMVCTLVLYKNDIAKDNFVVEYKNNEGNAATNFFIFFFTEKIMVLVPIYKHIILCTYKSVSFHKMKNILYY